MVSPFLGLLFALSFGAGIATFFVLESLLDMGEAEASPTDQYTTPLGDPYMFEDPRFLIQEINT